MPEIESQICDGRRYYELHHHKPINQGGGVYNLVIVTPRYHLEILEPIYYGYSGFRKYFR